MLELIEKLKKTPNTSVFKEEYVDGVKTTSIEFKPTYFYAKTYRATSKANTDKKSGYYVIKIDTSQPYGTQITVPYKQSFVDTIELLDDYFDLEPVVYNSKHNMMKLSLENPFSMSLGNMSGFHIEENICYTNDFVSHFSVVEHDDGTVYINIKSVEIAFYSNTTGLNVSIVDDFTFTINKHKKIMTVRDNTYGLRDIDSVINRFISLITSSFLTKGCFDDLEDYKDYDVLKGLVSKHLLDSDCPFEISNGHCRFSSGLKEIYEARKKSFDGKKYASF